MGFVEMFKLKSFNFLEKFCRHCRIHPDKKHQGMCPILLYDQEEE
jgi:hypothetical protein